ncbi:hypothetical protein T484DRAFT_1770287, partial [Baffinella frigidus]
AHQEKQKLSEEIAALRDLRETGEAAHEEKQRLSEEIVAYEEKQKLSEEIAALRDLRETGEAAYEEKQKLSEEIAALRDLRDTGEAERVALQNEVDHKGALLEGEQHLRLETNHLRNEYESLRETAERLEAREADLKKHDLLKRVREETRKLIVEGKEREVKMTSEHTAETFWS